MKISHCRLLKKTQSRLLEYFLLEVTARSAADILEIQPNSAALLSQNTRSDCLPFGARVSRNL